MKIGIAGYKGRMSQMLIKLIEEDFHKGASYRLSAVTTRLHGADSAPHGIPGVQIFQRPEMMFTHSDIVIDFTTPESTMENLEAAVKSGKPIVIGTTGLNAEQEGLLKQSSQFAPVLFAPNTSLGITLLLSLVEQAAAKLVQDWDIEIFESHHKNKIDAPSGTALALGKAAQKGRNGGDFVTDRNGRRTQGDIGYAVSRGGDVVGEHMVTFYGIGERIEIGHKATDRALFARGALQAAQWLHGKQAGLYTMRDVLGL